MDCRICRNREIECDGRPNRCLNCERSQLECDGNYGATTAPTADLSNATTSEDDTYTSDQIFHSEFSKVSSEEQQLSRETLTGSALAAAGHADHLRADSKQLSRDDEASPGPILFQPETLSGGTHYGYFGPESGSEHADNQTIHNTEKRPSPEPASPAQHLNHSASKAAKLPSSRRSRTSPYERTIARRDRIMNRGTMRRARYRNPLSASESISQRMGLLPGYPVTMMFPHGSRLESSAMGSEREPKRQKQQDFIHELDNIKNALTSDERSHAAKDAFHEVLDSCVQTLSPENRTSLPIDQVKYLETAHGLLSGAAMQRKIPCLSRLKPPLGQPLEPKEQISERVLFFQWDLYTSFSTGALGKDKGSVHETLNDFLTISGSEDSFECCSCSAFVTKYWGPTICHVTLLLISSALKELLKGSCHVKGSVAIPDGKDRRVYYTATKSNLTLFLESSSCDVDPMLEAVGWICSAVRQGTRELRVSSGGWYDLTVMHRIEFLAKISNDSDSPCLKSFVFSELQRHSVHERNPNIANNSSAGCWLRLFKTISIAVAILPRPWGRGLEIPFSLMVKLAAVENLCTMNGRTALVGYHTALIPTNEAKELDSIQWHFEYVTPDQGMLLPKQLQQFVGEKWLQLAAEDFPKKTCFLGWSSNANVMLGTRALVECSGPMQRSNLEHAETHQERETVQAIFQISLGIPGINPVAQGGMTWKYTNDMIARPPTDDYRMALNNARNKTCLLVDSHTKQAWLIPMLSVVFHLCHLYYQNSKDTDEPTPIPYIRPSSNGARTVINAIKDSANLEVLGSSFSSIFHQQYHNLDQYPRYAKDNYFHANDLMDVLENKTTFPRKVVLKGNGYMWPDLLPFAKAVDSVGVCANIGQVLEPTSRLGDLPCRCQKFSCDKLPEHRSYLAAHVPSLKLLCWQHESSQYWKIGQTGASWVLQPDAWRFPRCSSKSIWADAAITHKILQKTCRDAFKFHKYWTWGRPEIAQTSIEKDFPSDGVVVFGRWQDRLELASK